MRGLSGARILVTGAHGLYSLLIYENMPGPDPVMSALAEKDIQARRRLWPPLHRQSRHRAAERLRGDVAGRVYRRGPPLPSSSHLTQAEQRVVIKNLKELSR